MNKRKQLTLFITEKHAETIEDIRGKYNPAQYALIKAHVTLCREDEIENISTIIESLESLSHKSIIINFDKIVRFSNGKGVLISATKINTEYHELREEILKNANAKIKFHEPHITLMHPRNSTCTDEIFEKIKKCSFPFALSFEKISLIEQILGQPWKILSEYYLS